MRSGTIPILDINVNRRKQVLEATKNWKNCQVISVFVIAPAEIIYRKLLDRQIESIEELITRLHTGADNIMVDPAQREHVGEELADVLFFLLRFCRAYEFTPGEILVDKIYKNAKKYPALKEKKE